jgi:cardiolipin synthase (CMP-forming)
MRAPSLALCRIERHYHREFNRLSTVLVEPRAPFPPVSIPNLITLGRIILVPVVFWLVVSGRFQAAFFTFLIAGISDGVDGYLAKRYNWQTELGAYLDPLADKLLLVTVFVALGVLGALPSWLVIAVVSRDLLIVMAIVLSWVIGHPVAIKPHRVSKANTALQIALVALVLADEGFGLGWNSLRWVVIWATAALTVLSLGFYLAAWIRHMSRYAPDTLG